MQYPKHLLPHKDNKTIVFEDWLQSFFLLRHTPDQDLIDPDTGKLKFNYIVTQSDHLRDFSTNLLGTYLRADSKIVIRSSKERMLYFNGLWQENEVVEAPKFQEDFEINESRGCFFLCIGELEGQKVPISIADKYTGDAICKILHTPTRSNFWHFSIRWFTESGDAGSQKGAWVDRLFKTQVKTLIHQKALYEVPDCHQVEESYYT